MQLLSYIHSAVLSGWNAGILKWSNFVVMVRVMVRLQYI